jgi:hypothetical protein
MAKRDDGPSLAANTQASPEKPHVADPELSLGLGKHRTGWS